MVGTSFILNVLKDQIGEINPFAYDDTMACSNVISKIPGILSKSSKISQFSKNCMLYLTIIN
ncbi:protein of unknown function [Candidatus Nitrosocosmicus franklandus]|uniref:Uncharacterized protein n=1 Tax=Candidatus Nitrosocosmicus franklandianus TaxID=1798806 RepID=A0A484I5U3_9ARCH|nr:protein of unknown function [Candidatus Nitrosocosmicus franklandus]